MYEFNLDDVLLNSMVKSARRIILQFPDGLKSYALKIADEISNRIAAEVIVSMDPCYGGCDLAVDDAKRLGADLIIHFGHTEFVKCSEIPVVYVPVFFKFSLKDLAKKFVEIWGFRGAVGLLSTVQHIENLSEVEGFLSSCGVPVHVGLKCGRVKFNGQVLGCEVCGAMGIADLVDGFLVISGGDFHGLGVALSTGKTTYVMDPFRGEIRCLDNLVMRVLSVRWNNIVRARESKSFGVMVGVKPGQCKLNLALKVKRIIESSGRKCYLFSVRDFSADLTLPFRDIDVFVSAACPRIAIEEAEAYGKPILTPYEVKIALSGSMNPDDMRGILNEEFE
ncbi:MAG: diphthamide biosynthesis enzyme Dph2 [archaeon GBS-70-058]|nr:diphthamide biosynthesis enzyme Dph2 [Candidatus Culexarchaeum nevadense]